MRKYLITMILIFAMLWIVPHALGRWMSVTSNIKTIGSTSVFSDFDYSFLQNSIEENKIDLIELTIKHYNPQLDDTTQDRIISEIVKASNENKLDPFIVTAVIAAESSFKPEARSHCGARGLMQLTRVVLPELGVTNPYDIGQNIQGGCKFLGELYRRFGNTTLALAAYNAGPTRVARLRRVPRIRETQNYVKRVQWLASVLFEHFLMALEEKSVNPVAYIVNLSKRSHPYSTIVQYYDNTTQYSKHTEPISTYTQNYVQLPATRLGNVLIDHYNFTTLFEKWSYFG